MFIYILLATLLFLFAASSKKQASEKKLYLLTLLILVIFDGLRWESGTDWGNYCNYFTFCLLDSGDRFEFGYVLLNKAIRLITPNYTWFLLIHAFILYLSLGLFFKRNSNAPLLSLALFFAFFVSYQGMNRQFLAVCFCLFAYHFLLGRKKTYFIILVLAGSLFHISSFFFLVGLLFSKQYRIKTYTILIFVAIVIGNLGFVKTFIDLGLSYLGPKIGYLLDFYSQVGQSSISLISVLFAYFRRLLIIVPMLVYMKSNKLPKPISHAFNFYYIGFIMYILFNGTSLQVMVARGNVYFMIFECILIPYIVFVYRKKVSKALLMSLIYAFALLNMVKGIHSYDVLGQNPFIPYKSIYYNTDVTKNTK